MLKKEVRILGLSAATGRMNRTLVVGIVYRGRFWLDGILACTLEHGQCNENSAISRAIKCSRQYSQLHAVILSSRLILRSRQIDIDDLARRLRLPVIALETKAQLGVSKGKKLGKFEQHRLVVNGRRISVLATRISLGMIQGIFSVSCMPGCSVPEAVRVADLTARQVTLKWSSLGLA